MGVRNYLRRLLPDHDPERLTTTGTAATATQGYNIALNDGSRPIALAWRKGHSPATAYLVMNVRRSTLQGGSEFSV